MYLSCEYTVQEGKYENRKVWSLIGLHSEKGDKYRQMGCSFMRGICDSAHRLDPKDKMAGSNNIRNDFGFDTLDGTVFLAKIEVEQDQNGNDKNVIRYAITKGHTEYDKLMPKENGRFRIGGEKKQELETEMPDDEIPF